MVSTGSAALVVLPGATTSRSKAQAETTVAPPASASGGGGGGGGDDLLDLDVDRLKRTIAAGRVYQQSNFLDEVEVLDALQEVKALNEAGAFEVSGLSNTARGRQQAFSGRKDRRLTPVPWWNDALASEATTTENNSSNSSSSVAFKTQKLRRALADVLKRPTMDDPGLAHECYYSVAGPGSFLARHMDERHEELKGAKGWLLPSRRSLSWLIYLSDEGWTLHENGGALRSFPQASIAQLTTDEGHFHHKGDLQVGWLMGDNETSRPVYLDSWYTPAGSSDPHCILYCVDERDRSIVPMTKPWQSDAISDMSVVDFIASWSARDAAAESSSTMLFLHPETARSFTLIEDRVAWDAGQAPLGSVIEDINPERGSLVIFDSVALPHQVEEIRQGHRIALAGWFHEETQGIPDELILGTSSSVASNDQEL